MLKEQRKIELPPQDLKKISEAKDKKDNLPQYERKPHHPESAVARIILKTLNRKKDEITEGKKEKNISSDMVDSMLLELIALADEYLLMPQNLSAADMQRKRINEYQLFQEKNGQDLADTFLEQLDQEKQNVIDKTQEDQPINNQIEQAIAKLLAFRQVREEALKIIKTEHSLRKSSKKSVSELIALENAIDSAKARYRQIQNEPKNIDPKSSILPKGVLANNLSKYAEIVENLEQRIKIREAGLSYQELGLLQSARLLKTRHQMKEFGFAMTESRQALFDRISELTSAGYKVFLGGPTGTGKTSLAVFAMRQIVGNENSFDVISWSSEITGRDLFGKPIIKSDLSGKIESSMQKGPYARVLSGETRGIVNDEYTSGQTASQLTLKRIYQARAGESINLPGFNGQVFSKENYFEISTGNLRSKQHQQREEMDPAIAREFVAISVPFMNSEEAKQVLLASFMHESGFLPLSRQNVEMIDQLCRVAEFTQKAFEDKFTPEERQSDIYKQIEPSGAPIHLTKTFFDSGTLFRLIGGLSGKSFSKHLKTNLDREINNNPHLETLPQEKEVFKKILRAYGFDIDELNKTFYTSVAKAHKREFLKPYILPSELGFLKSVQKINDDEFPDNKTPEGEIDEMVNNLLNNPNIPDSVKAELISEETKTSPEIASTFQEAKEIMQEDFLGPEEINNIFGIEIKNIPPIPFSRDELIRAKELGQFLIFRTSEIPNNKLVLPNTKKTLGKAPQTRWALVSKEVLGYKDNNPSSDQAKISTNKNYLEQTEVLINYLKNEVFIGRPIPLQYQEAINEFESQKEELRPLAESTNQTIWKSAAQRLANLKITQLARRTTDEGLYDLEVYYQKNKTYLLPKQWDWSSSISSSGGLVGFGAFDAGGADVRALLPGYRYDLLGVSFSRCL